MKKFETLNAVSIKPYRMAKGISVQEFAKLTGLSRTMIYNYESGLNTPSPKTLVKIAEVLGVEPIKLIGG